MKILHLLNDGCDGLSARIIEAQRPFHELTVIDLSRGPVCYEKVVDEIMACDLVISW
ncbi:MAG: hypothetical protein OHK006_04660 [Thermodesulfovibrionales bacterium]